METKQLLTVDEIASRCQVSKQTVYKAIRRGHLSAHRFGRSVRISESALEAYLDRGWTLRREDT